MARSLIAIGSNLGDRAATLDASADALARTSGVELLSRSSWQLTLPVGGDSSHHQFLNGAMLLETSHSPQQLLRQLQQIEQQFGRERRKRWGDRTLDLDLLLYGDAVVSTPELTVPHPRMSFRRFVLEPAVEISSEMVHPTIGWTLQRLLDQLETGADAVALVSQDDDARDGFVADLSCRFELELGAPPVRDEARWPARATAWMRLPDSPQTSGEPKLTIVLNEDEPTVPGRGPTLRVPAADGQEVMTDVFAAVEAVWPRLGSLPSERLQ